MRPAHLLFLLIASFSLVQLSHASTEGGRPVDDCELKLSNAVYFKTKTQLLSDIQTNQKLKEEITPDLLEMQQVLEAELKKTTPLQIYLQSRQVFIKLQRAIAIALKDGLYHRGWLELSIYYAVAMDLKEQLGYDSVTKQAVPIQNPGEYYKQRTQDLLGFIPGYESVLQRSKAIKASGKTYDYILLVPSHTTLTLADIDELPYVVEVRLTSSVSSEGEQQTPPSQRMLQDLERAYFSLVDIVRKQ